MRQLRGLAVIAAIGALAGCGGETSTAVPAARMLTPKGAIHAFPAFSPDGRHVAYLDASPGRWGQLVVADSDLSHAMVVDSSIWYQPPFLWSPDGTWLAYSIGTDYNLRIARPGDGPPRQLTNEKGEDFPIQWQPAGPWLTYGAMKKGVAASREADIETGASRPFPAPVQPALPYRSPDGSRIAYDVLGGGKSTIWIADSTGAHARPLTTEGFERFTGIGSPWSPDGSELLYMSRRTGRQDLWVLDVDQDSARQLTRDVRDDYAGAWSRDGTSVAFLSDRGNQTDIWVISSAGGTPKRVTDDAASESASGLQWIGGSKRLAFTTAEWETALWTHSLTDGSERRLTPDSIRAGFYNLSPDRTEIVFEVHHGGGVTDLDVVSVNGGAPRTLVANGSENGRPTWSPDGTRIAFTSTKNGSADVWVVDTAGAEAKALTDWQGEETTPMWSPSGDSIYFRASHEADPFDDVWEVSERGGAPRRLTHVGSVQDLAVSPMTGDVFVSASASDDGQTALSRLLPDGELQPVWNRTNLLDLAEHAFGPTGDSVALWVAAPGGGDETRLLPTHGGKGRSVLGTKQEIIAWSSDGTRTAYVEGGAKSDVYVMDMRDGTAVRMTDTPQQEGRPLFTAGDSGIVFLRTTQESRIATVDVAGLMRGQR